ncbi:MAG: uroporphyrinogen decarboxylase family protein [Anaerolineae bacterium]|nr:uroporphyrinogen decarboxylase family protein [Anaerolineae bacterium]
MRLATDTDFGRVRRAMLREGGNDRVPLFELSVHNSLKSQFLGRPVRTWADEVEFWQAAGYDFVPVRAGVRSVVRGVHPVVAEWIRERRPDRLAQHGRGWADETVGIIATRSEFEQFPWPAPETLSGYDAHPTLEAQMSAISECLPPGMKVIPQLGYIFMGAWQIMGLENFSLQLADDPEFVKGVIDRLGRLQMAVLDILLQYGCVGAIWMPDDLCYNAGPLVSPKVYRRLVYPWYQAIIRRCHQANLPVGFHSDGDLTRVLADLVECGFDSIHPFEPPMNDIVAVKREWGHRISVAGNIDLKATLCAGTPADVEAEVRQKAAALAPGGGWLIGSSNSIPDFVPFENYLALLECSLKFGRYTAS